MKPPNLFRLTLCRMRSGSFFPVLHRWYAARSKLRKAAEKGIAVDANKVNWELLSSEFEKALAKKREAEEKKLEKAKATAYNAAKKGIETAGMVDYTRAYEYALSMGVDDESARALAKSTTTVARDAAIEKIVKMIFNRRLTRDQAEEYASGLGLSDNDVKET